ncbi:MAG: hypothetical protein K1X83_05350 [Oligoflexia bacterium]|nr:hypothetical protein [Oligoflexia bacterium]
MNELLGKLAQQIEAKLTVLNQERLKDGLLSLSLAEISLLGQFSLIVNPEVNSKLQLANTVDVDALLKCDWSARTAIKEVLLGLGFVYDEHSEEIWIPPNSKFILLYESSNLRIEAIEPLFALVSKAVKAPHKNRFLIQQAIGIYGSPLIRCIRQNGGNINLFLK